MKNMMNTFKQTFPVITLAFVALMLIGCGGGAGGGDSQVSSGVSIGGSGGSSSGGTGGSSGSSTGSALVGWIPPTQKTDGSTLLNLAGYNIYYGTEAGNYTEVVSINNVGITSRLIEDLPSGNTYYFVVTAVDSQGNESAYSAVGSKSI